MDTIIVNYPNGSYPIYIGNGLLREASLLQKHVVDQQIMIVSNKTVAPLYMTTLQKAFTHYACDSILLPDGERYKTLTQMNKIIDMLAEHNHHRDTTLIALGGGVIGDMAGFAAACYHRGVAFIQVPTTLLAQVDASIGGKTGVNHPKGKNLIGAFHQPQAVIIDTNTLTTLPNREFRAGIAEIIKAALIKDENFFNWLEHNLDKLIQRDAKIIHDAIKQACHIKCDIVSIDVNEKTGERALLNLGHTFAHAIEQNLEYQQWLHGEAVSVGLVLAARLSEKIGWLNSHDLKRIEEIITRAHLPVRLPKKLNPDVLIATMWQDKKILHQQLRFVLLQSIGNAILFDTVLENQVKNLLATTRDL